MSGVAKEHLLTAKQMAQFVLDGFLLLDGFIPQELNERVYAEQQAGNGYWDKGDAIHEVFELPQVKGILQSLGAIGLRGKPCSEDESCSQKTGG